MTIDAKTTKRNVSLIQTKQKKKKKGMISPVSISYYPGKRSAKIIAQS